MTIYRIRTKTVQDTVEVHDLTFSQIVALVKSCTTDEETINDFYDRKIELTSPEGNSILFVKEV